MRTCLLACLALAACTDSASDPADLVATWRRVPAHFEADQPIDQRAQLTLGADRTFAMDERHGDPVDTGTYTADATTITFVGVDSKDGYTTLVDPYVVTGGRMMLAPMFPAGTVDGFVGTWHGTQTEKNTSGGTKTFTSDFTLHADGTAHLVAHADTDVTLDGTWTQDTDEIAVTTMQQGSTVTFHFQSLPGVDALGGALFEKL